MSEIEKMYGNANVKKHWNSTPYGGIEEYYPPFTAEKQIELIKWLAEHKNGFDVFYDTSFNSKEKHYWCCADQYYEDFMYGCHKKEFSEALAGLVNELPLTEEEQQQVKGILE